MNSFIISAVGSDRPGIVSQISGVITSHGGNIEESRMSRLGSDFAIIMLVSVTQDWVESLKIALQSINELTIICKSTKTKEIKEGLKYEISLSCADNEGIVKVLSKYLAEKSINIVEMETYISQASVSGTPLFNLMATIIISENSALVGIQSELALIAEKLGVEITVNQSGYREETA